MPGINQLPAGSELAAAVSLIWVSCSEICSCLLLWLAWSHEEGWSYLALLAISTIISNTCSIIQQGHDVAWYTYIVTEQFNRKQKLPGSDPELAIAGGSFGIDLVLYYIQYYNYNVQAMLVMFWAAELCQLTYQVGEKRKIRRLFRKVHTCGKFISWILPLITILCLRLPNLKEQFVAFILIADLPLMLSLAIGSGLMVAVTIRYVQSRQKFTQWTPPKFNSTTTSEGGTMTSGTHQSTTPTTSNTSTRKGLYDRWLMVRFTIAFILLAVFEVTNTLFQVTALNNNMNDAKASAPDLSTGRAIETMFLYMPGSTPGIFIFVVFGTTAASRQKLKDNFLPKRWRGVSKSTGGCCFGRRKPRKDAANKEGTGIHVERSLTITSASRIRASQAYDDCDQFSDPSDISMSDLPKRSDSTRSNKYGKPLPLAPRAMAPSSKFAPQTVVTSRGPLASAFSPHTNNNRPQQMSALSSNPVVRGGGGGGFGLSAIEEKNSTGKASTGSAASSDVFDLTMERTDTQDSLRVPDDYHGMGPEHSDDSGPILPIQRPEVHFASDLYSYDNEGRPGAREGPRRDRLSKNFSRPRR